MSNDGPIFPDADLADLPGVMADAGYAADPIRRIQSASTADGAVDRVYLRRFIAEPVPLHILYRLFHEGETVPVAAVEPVLGADLLERLARAGMILRDTDDVRAVVRIEPFRDLLLASDLRAVDGTTRTEHVLGLSPTGRTLAQLTPRPFVDAALDVGTGGGVQALLTARHAGRVTGVDIGPRALAFAALNARINGIANVDWRKGSYFEPVANETFGLVVSNPPFAISPESRYTYRDSGLRGDEVSALVVRGAARHLAPGGFAVSLISWYHGEDDWSERPRTWTHDTGCDVLLMRAYSVTPLDYAALFLRQTETHDAAHYDRLLGEWLHNFEALGAQRIAVGSIVLRRRTTGTPWFRADNAASLVGDAGDHIMTLFRNEDLVRGPDVDRRLLDLHLQLAPAHVLEHRLRLSDGRWVAEQTRLRLTDGLTTEGDVDAMVVQLLQGCDGRRPFRRAIEDLARTSGGKVEAAIPNAVALAKRLLRTGVLQVRET